MLIKPISLLKTKMGFKIDLNIIVVILRAFAFDIYESLWKTSLFSLLFLII